MGLGTDVQFKFTVFGTH